MLGFYFIFFSVLHYNILSINSDLFTLKLYIFRSFISILSQFKAIFIGFKSSILPIINDLSILYLGDISSILFLFLNFRPLSISSNLLYISKIYFDIFRTIILSYTFTNITPKSDRHRKLWQLITENHKNSSLRQPKSGKTADPRCSVQTDVILFRTSLICK